MPYPLLTDVFRFLILSYLVVAAICLGLAVWKPKTRHKKIRSAIGVLAVFSILPGWAFVEYLHSMERAKAARQQWANADAIFRAHCEKAGVTIHRTVDDVDGFLLMKIRPDHVNYSDQYGMDDPYGDDYGGDAYIESFLWGRGESGNFDLLGPLPVTSGYAYVDAVDPKDGVRYRYTANYLLYDGNKSESGFSNERFKFQLKKSPVTGDLPRYGLTYEDISSPSDRDHWVAGSSLKVVDLETNEVIAERIGYTMDPELGSREGFRLPWPIALRTSCPAFPLLYSNRPDSIDHFGQTRRFVESVLKLKQVK